MIMSLSCQPTEPVLPFSVKQESRRTAHRGWARLLLDRTRDLIINGTAHHGTNGAAMPTDEDDHDGSFFFNHPERRGTLLPPRRAQPLLSPPISNPPH